MKSSSRLAQAEYEMLASFRYSLRKFLHFSEKAARDAGVTPQQYQAMLAIRGCPEGQGMTMGRLAAELFVAPHSAVGLVDRLEKEELVSRRHSKEDRRQVEVRLAPKGRAFLEKLAAVHRQELKVAGPEIVAFLEQLK